MKYYVVRIMKDKSNADTKEFPHLIKYLEGNDEGLFVVNESGEFYPAGEFFYLKEVTEFTTKEQI